MEAQLECVGTMPKRRTRGQEEYLGLLDIMAEETYLLQEAIYSNGQTMIGNYNETRIDKGDNGKQ